MKILQKLSPLLILAIVAILWVLYNLITHSISESWGWSLMGVIILTWVGVISLVVDWIFKKTIKNWKKVFLIEVGVIALLLLYYSYQNRYLTFQLPENFSTAYVSVIYNVAPEKEFAIHAFTWRKTIEVPHDGIILTASKRDEILPKIDFKTSDGVSYSQRGDQKIFMKLSDVVLEHNGQEYAVSTWKMGEGTFIEYSSEREAVAYKQNLINTLQARINE